MTALALLMVGIALLVAVAWTWEVVSDHSARRWGRVTLCPERGCIRAAGHPGLHLDDVGRSWRP